MISALATIQTVYLKRRWLKNVTLHQLSLNRLGQVVRLRLAIEVHFGRPGRDIPPPCQRTSVGTHDHVNPLQVSENISDSGISG